MSKAGTLAEMVSNGREHRPYGKRQLHVLVVATKEEDSR